MSINTLTHNPESGSKEWANLYVNSLTTYKDLTVNGDLKLKGGSQNFYEERAFAYQPHYGSLTMGQRDMVAVKVGKLVSIWVNQYDILTTPEASYYRLEPVDPIPAEFLPVDSFEKPVIVSNGGSNSGNTTKQIGNLTFDKDTGEIYIYSSVGADPFDSGVFASFNDVMISYIVD